MEAGKRYRLKLSRAKEIVCISNAREEYKAAGKDADLIVVKNGSIIVGTDGKIVKVAPADEIDK